MSRIGIAVQIIALLSERDLSNAPTLGDIADAIGLRKGSAIGERLREARVYYGYDIRCIESGRGRNKEFRYWMPPAERRRARAFVADRIKAAA